MQFNCKSLACHERIYIYFFAVSFPSSACLTKLTSARTIKLILQIHNFSHHISGYVDIAFRQLKHSTLSMLKPVT